MKNAKQDSKGNNDIGKTASSTSIDQTIASEVSLDQTCYSEGLATCTSQVDVKTATDGLNTCRDNPEGDERTCRNVDSTRTAKASGGEDLKTAAGGSSIRTARHRSVEDLKTAVGACTINTARHRSTEDLKTATDGSSTTHTARHRSVEDLKTAVGASTINTARHRSTEDLKTATGASSINTARHRSVEDLKTAAGGSSTRTARGKTESVERIDTAIDHADGTRTAIYKSKEELRTCRNSSTSTCKEDVKTAVSDVQTAMSEVDVRTSRNIESSLGTRRSNENVKTANDAALLTAIQSKKSEEDVKSSIDIGAAIQTALLKSMSNVNMVGSINTCSLENVRTAYDLSEEQVQALTGYESEYCMDVTPDTASSSLVLSAASQYQLTDLRNYSALNDPTTAYQYKIQETLPPNYSKSVSTTDSEYLAPDMTGTN